MSAKKGRVMRLTQKEQRDIAYKAGIADGRHLAEDEAAGRAAKARAEAPRRSFWIEQNESGFTLTESTSGSVRGKSWSYAEATDCGAQIDQLCRTPTF